MTEITAITVLVILVTAAILGAAAGTIVYWFARMVAGIVGATIEEFNRSHRK